MKTEETRSSAAAPSKAKAKAQRAKASVKRNRKASNSKANGKARKASKKTRKANGKANGGGKALSDFGNAAKLRVLKAKEIPARAACFKTGQTVSANLAAQKAKGFRGRRKFIRAQIAQGRVSVS